ncbi:MAG: glycoside hydrolase domain-containing protein, partial [Bacteroidota bacterium]
YYGFTIHEIREMQIMNMGNYAHGNQPIQHMIYLYNYAKQPWKAQSKVREVLNKLYTPTPDGYCGDEDNGQTSAWYVFSALGFYPVAPATNQYIIGSPLFDKATLHLQNGNTFTITSKGNGMDNPFIQSASLNNESFDATWISKETVQQGGALHFEMGPAPNKEWGVLETSKPYSLSNSKSLE